MIAGVLVAAVGALIVGVVLADSAYGIAPGDIVLLVGGLLLFALGCICWQLGAIRSFLIARAAGDGTGRLADAQIDPPEGADSQRT